MDTVAADAAEVSTRECRTVSVISSSTDSSASRLNRCRTAAMATVSQGNNIVYKLRYVNTHSLLAGRARECWIHPSGHTNVYITFTTAFRIGSECPFIERLVRVKTFS